MPIATQIDAPRLVRFDMVSRASARRTVFVILAGSALVGSLLAVAPEDTARAIAWSGDGLARLLRFMAVVKGGMALAVGAVVVWRLDLPVSFPRFMLYTTAAMAMAAGCGTMWGLAHVGIGALLLHGGLGVTLVLLWRDPAVAARLSEAVARRRRDLDPRSADPSVAASAGSPVARRISAGAASVGAD